MQGGTSQAIVVAGDLDRRQLRGMAARNVGVGVALSVSMALLSGPIVRLLAAGGNAAVLRGLSPAIGLFSLALVPLGLLTKHLKFREQAGVQAVAAISSSCLSVAAVFLGAGVWSLVLRQLLLYGLLGILSLRAARDLFPPTAQGNPVRPGRARARPGPFLMFALTDYVVFNLDYLMIGLFTNATQLGLYSLAFSLAFTPVLEFSHMIGTVLFPLAAISGAEAQQRRTLAGVRVTTILFAPLIPAVFILAPTLVPALLGNEWRGAVRPFEILVVVGVAHAVLNIVGESLAGTGHVGFRARVNTVWMIGMAGALAILVPWLGILGAALAHLVLYIPVIIIYATSGIRRLGLSLRQVAHAVRAPVIAAVVQAAVSVTAWLTLAHEVRPDLARGLGAALGIGAGIGALVTIDPSLICRARTLYRERAL
jgi:O-antigen/teichoic acid export membrane protein